MIARLPTKSWTCSAPLRIPGWATGLSGLNLPLPFVPQSTVNRPGDPPAAGCGSRTFGGTFSIGTNWSRLVAASAVPLPPPETKVTVSAPVAASTSVARAIRAGRVWTSGVPSGLRFIGNLLQAGNRLRWCAVSRGYGPAGGQRSPSAGYVMVR